MLWFCPAEGSPFRRMSVNLSLIRYLLPDDEREEDELDARPAEPELKLPEERPAELGLKLLLEELLLEDEVLLPDAPLLFVPLALLLPVEEFRLLLFSNSFISFHLLHFLAYF